MKRIFLSVFIGLLLLCKTVNATVTASTNKQNFSSNERIILTLKADENVSAMPDLSVLKDAFNVLSSSVSKKNYIINGKQSAETTWEFALAPKMKGKVVVPSIVVGKEKTNSVIINISEGQEENSENGQTNINEPIYQLETEVQATSKKMFVQEKIDYFVRLKDNGQMQNISISFEEPSDFMVKQIGEPTVKILEDGKREITFLYALFAQKSGEIKIPDVTLSGYVLQKPDVNTIFGGGFFQINMPSFFGVDAPITLEQKGEKIEILPALKEYNGGWWLPAQNVEIVSKFIDLPYHITKGSTLTREITLKAVGLLDSQLPELDIRSTEDVKQYPEKPTGQTIVSDGKIIGIQKTLDTFIVAKDGEIFLPEIKVPWYDVDDGQIKTAVLKKERLVVQKDVLENKAEENTFQQEEVTKEKKIEEKKENPLKPYFEIGLAFLAGILLTYLILKPKKEKKEKPISIDDVIKESKKKDLKALRDNLILWARKEYSSNNVSNLKDVADIFQNADLNKAIDSLSSALYDERKTKNFDEKGFKKALKNAVKDKKKRKVLNDSPIPPLYQ